MPRLFEQNGFTDATGKVLPLEDFRLFTELQGEVKIDPRYHEAIIERAEKLITQRGIMIVPGMIH